MMAKHKYGNPKRKKSDSGMKYDDNMSYEEPMEYSSMGYKKTQVPSDDPWLKVASHNMGKSYARRT